MRLEAGCYLQSQWDSMVLSEMKELKDLQASQLLLSSEGPVEKFLKGPASPFIVKSAERGHYAKKVSEETKLTAQFTVPYQPGELIAIGLKDGNEVTRQTLKTTGKPAQLKIIAEENTFPGVQNDLAYFNIEVLDENGLLVPDAEIQIEFEISGPCKLQAVASENPKEMHSFQQPRVKTYRGKCQLVVRLEKGGGEIVVTAKSEGLKTATN